MTETTLTMNLTKLRKYVVQHMSGGRDYGAKSADEQQMVDDIIDSGYRNFLFPSLPDGKAHSWSFLNPRATLSLNAAYSTGTVAVTSGVVTLTSGTFPSWAASGVVVIDGVAYDVSTRDSGTQVTLTDTSVTEAAGTSYTLDQRDYALPDDFGGITEDLIYQERSLALKKIALIAEEQLMSLRATFETSAQIPYYASIRYKTTDATDGQRQEILFYPAPDVAYTLSYRYSRLPNALTTSSPYPYGGAQYAELLKESCLAVAEMFSEDRQGVHSKRFNELLVAAVRADQTQNRYHVGYLDERGCSQYVGEGCGGYSPNMYVPEVQFIGAP